MADITLQKLNLVNGDMLTQEHIEKIDSNTGITQNKINENSNKIGDLTGLTYTNLADNVKKNTTDLSQKANQSALDTTNQNVTANTNNISIHATQIASLSSASPKGVYATLSALQTAYPTGNSNTYIVNGDIKEVDTLTVTAIPTVAGNITITLNGVDFTVALTSAMTTTDAVATAIRGTSFSGWTTGGTGSVVTFTKTTSGTNTIPVFSANSTGSTATIAVTTAGVNADYGWYYWNSSAWTRGNTYQSAGIANNSVTKSKVNSYLVEDITNNFTFKSITMIDYTGIPVTYGATPYNNYKTTDYYQITNGVKLKVPYVAGGYDTAYKYFFYNSSKTKIIGSGVFVKDIGTLTSTSSPVSFDGINLIFDFDAVKTKYPTAYYICISFLNSETPQIYDISQKNLEWINVSKYNLSDDLKNTINKLENTIFEKPFVIFDFDWYADMYGKRYQILKKEYGYNATFCLDSQTTNYNLDSYLTRAQFNEMIASGWDYAFYGGVGDRGTTTDSWITYIKGIVDQKATMGIFNPVIYNTPDNNNASYISNAVKNNGFKLQRCTTNDNLLKSPSQYQTGAMFMTTAWVNNIKSKIDECIAKNCGVVLYTHLVIADSSNISDGQDASGGHCYETSFRQILNYIKSYVDQGKLEVLTAREYYSKYHKHEAIENDYNRNVKMQNFICSKLTF